MVHRILYDPALPAILISFPAAFLLIPLLEPVSLLSASGTSWTSLCLIFKCYSHRSINESFEQVQRTERGHIKERIKDRKEPILGASREKVQ